MLTKEARRMKRNIITIDEEKCTGCGLCIPNCPEGAIKIIDGKARLISDLLCDGLGACLGHCPEDAITIEGREAEEYDERKVMENIVKQGTNTVKAHLAHLRDHKEDRYYNQAVEYLREHHIPIPEEKETPMETIPLAGCPGSRITAFAREDRAAEALAEKRSSQLTHWPIQMHLVSPKAPHYQGADMLLAADCVAYSLGDFHKDYLKGKALGIACPKLDEGKEIYLEKLKTLIDIAKINTLTVMIMQVPCCSGLVQLAQHAASHAGRKIPIKCIVLGIEGEILREAWV
jgi:Pyruvate/2-oxoacid:ferredoxin oxidoreductase delta subunit